MLNSTNQLKSHVCHHTNTVIVTVCISSAGRQRLSQQALRATAVAPHSPIHCIGLKPLEPTHPEQDAHFNQTPQSCSSGKIFAVWIAAVATLSGVHAQSGVKVAAPFVNVGVDGQPGADGRRYVDVNVMGIRVRAPLRPRGEQNYGFAGAPPGAYGAAPVMPNGYAAAPGQVIPNGYGAAPAMPAYAGAPLLHPLLRSAASSARSNERPANKTNPDGSMVLVYVCEQYRTMLIYVCFERKYNTFDN